MNKILSYGENVSNKLPANLRGLVTVAESSDWLAWPDGPYTKTSSAAQQQGCKFLGVSLT